MQKFCCALLVFCSVLFCIPQPPAHSADLAYPANISMQDVFLHFLKFCYQREIVWEKKDKELRFNKLTEQDEYNTSYALKIKNHLNGSAIIPYIKTLKSTIRATKEQGIKAQKKEGVRNGIPLPYLYIDENRKFVKYIPDYSNTKIVKGMMYFTGFPKEYSLELIPTFHMQLLPLTARQPDGYMLIVTYRAYEYEEYGDMWLFTVTKQHNNKQKPFVFTEIQAYSGLAPGQSTPLIEAYGVFDFDPKRSRPHPEVTLVVEAVYDIDKSSGELFIYEFGDSDTPLRFVWDGKKYAKKGIVQRDLNQAREAKRGQE